MSSDSSEYHRFPEVASNGDKFLVVWRTSSDPDFATHGIFGQFYTSDGAPIGSNFLVNTYTTMTKSTLRLPPFKEVTSWLLGRVKVRMKIIMVRW